MAFEATFYHGDPTMVDYTPLTGDVAAGQVIPLGNITLVAHLDIGNGTLGAAACGGGVYKVLGNGSIPAGVKVYWDNTNNVVSTVAAGNMPFGKSVGNDTTANVTFPVLHAPYF